MKKYTAIPILALALSGCGTTKEVIVIEKQSPVGTSVKPVPKQVGIVGVWSGSSYGESINVKFGSNGSLILNNAAGANSGSWSSQGSNRFAVNIAGQSGSMVLLNSSTASLNIGGSTIELRK